MTCAVTHYRTNLVLSEATTELMIIVETPNKHFAALTVPNWCTNLLPMMADKPLVIRGLVHSEEGEAGSSLVISHVYPPQNTHTMNLSVNTTAATLPDSNLYYGKVL